jgi:hypothetical protein
MVRYIAAVVIALSLFSSAANAQERQAPVPLARMTPVVPTVAGKVWIGPPYVLMPPRPIIVVPPSPLIRISPPPSPKAMALAALVGGVIGAVVVNGDPNARLLGAGLGASLGVGVVRASW